jgi:hypothetical protein
MQFRRKPVPPDPRIGQLVKTAEATLAEVRAGQELTSLVHELTAELHRLLVANGALKAEAEHMGPISDTAAEQVHADNAAAEIADAQPRKTRGWRKPEQRHRGEGRDPLRH